MLLMIAGGEEFKTLHYTLTSISEKKCVNRGGQRTDVVPPLDAQGVATEGSSSHGDAK